MNHYRRAWQTLIAATLLAPASAAAAGKPGEPRTWGNITFVDLAVGEAYPFAGKNLKLVALENHCCTVDVEGVQRTLKVARRALPEVINGVRIFVSDNRVVAGLTTDKPFSLVHAATTRDALLALSDPARPLVDPAAFVFPISRQDGYTWHMEEDSHQFAYLGPDRSHEGIDLDMHAARGRDLHPLVAMEAGTVRWVEKELTSPNEAWVLIESASQPGIYYTYQHLNRGKVLVSTGQKVSRGQRLGFIWGDNVWGHLHFAVVGYGAEPKYTTRKRYLLNAFPVLYELWHGDLQLRERSWTNGQWIFGRHRAENGNRSYRYAYDPILGYGWDLGRWCPADKVEVFTPRDRDIANNRDTHVLLRKTLYPGERAAATNPRDCYEFHIDVKAGRYRVQARVGAKESSTWQRVSFNGLEAGTYAQAKGMFAWTPPQEVASRDGRLTFRIDLKDAETPACVSALHFERTGDAKEPYPR
jgi:murein DD-endopeptidase MepM/ murein hydrolase activator NlpD